MLQSIVDTREPWQIWMPLVEKGWLRQVLKAGDFRLASEVNISPHIERKTVKQYITDMESGQLMQQARRLIEATPFPILLVEGHWLMTDGIHLLDSNITWEQAWNEMQTIQDMGCRLQLTTSIAHTVRRVVELYHYYYKEHHESAQRQLSGDHRIACLCLIYGVGEVKARAILNWLEKQGISSSISSVAALTVEQLDQVEGIGEALARRIWQWFHEGVIK